MSSDRPRALALDTSVAIPLLMKTHAAHGLVVDWWNGRDVALCGHALVETYSVLTRLPGDNRVDPRDASQLITERFAAPVLLSVTTASDLPRILAEAGIAGGAVYDAIVGLAAVDNDRILATRDARAIPTYRAVGADVHVVA